MPTYPSPGKGLVISGINKEDGWGSRNAAGQVVAGHAGDQGINHAAGLSKSGLDTGANPVVTNVAESALTPTGVTITWTTATSQPNGQVYYQRAGAQQQVQLETGGPRTAHTVTLSGLTEGASYSYVIYQPAAGTPPAGKTEAAGTFVTPLAGEDPPPEGMSLGVALDGVGAPPMVNGGAPAAAFGLNNLKANNMGATEMTVTWRTEVYADGTVMYRPVGGPSATVDEVGVKRLNHSVTVTGLEPATQYEVAVISADAQGNTSEGGPITATTLPA